MRVAIIGDGPGGLSAALFLAKAGIGVSVFGQDKTAMHFALLRNYLGIPEVHGSDFQRIAREQATRFGARLVPERVESVEPANGAFTLRLANGESESAEFLILSEGKSPRLALQLGLEFDEKNGVAADVNSQTKLARVYVVGRLRRPGRSQAIISAGDGAAAAIDIISTIRGESYTDWEEPAKDAP